MSLSDARNRVWPAFCIVSTLRLRLRILGFVNVFLRDFVVSNGVFGSYQCWRKCWGAVYKVFVVCASSHIYIYIARSPS